MCPNSPICGVRVVASTSSALSHVRAEHLVGDSGARPLTLPKMMTVVLSLNTSQYATFTYSASASDHPLRGPKPRESASTYGGLHSCKHHENTGGQHRAYHPVPSLVIGFMMPSVLSWTTRSFLSSPSRSGTVLSKRNIRMNRQ